MSTPLPAQPSLRQLQIQAKELAKQLKRAHPDALARLHTHHPNFRSLNSDKAPIPVLKLHDAQLVISREYGFDSWIKLSDEVNRVSLRRLVEAVERGDTTRARTLLRQNQKLVHFDMSETDEHRVIHYAVLRRDEPMVRALMQAGADARKGVYPQRDATTAYVMARDREFSDIVAAIEEEEELRRRDLSCPNTTVSPVQYDLYDRIRKGDYSNALTVLEADPGLTNACDRDGGTMLHVACEEGALSVVDWLLQHRANPRKKNVKGWTALESAVLRVGWKERDRCVSFPEVAEKVLRHGAVISPLVASALGDLEALHEFNRRDPKTLREVHLLHRGGPLSVTVTFGKPDALKLLLDLGLDPNERHKLPDLEEEVYSEGQPLWLAAAFGEHEMAKMLLECGADPSAQVYASGTPVYRAYGLRDEPMKQLLASYGGRPEPYIIGVYRDIDSARELLRCDSRDKTIEDLVWGAACGGSPEIVEMCLARLNWTPTDKRWHRLLASPLSLANHAPYSEHSELYERSTYPECLRLILQHGVDVNVRSRKSETLIHSIIASGKIWGREVMTNSERLEFIRIALEASPDLTVHDDLLKSTPLGWACRWGREDIVRLLLEHGVEVAEPDTEPWATPIAWASRMGHHSIYALLQDHL